jgi:hypothetical protein
MKLARTRFLCHFWHLQLIQGDIGAVVHMVVLRGQEKAQGKEGIFHYFYKLPSHEDHHHGTSKQVKICFKKKHTLHQLPTMTL